MELDERLEQVVDRDSFFAFVRALIKDRQAEVMGQEQHPIDRFGRGPHGWEHHTIEDYLDAALACAEDRGDRAEGLPKEPSWKAFATFLYRGKYYE